MTVKVAVSVFILVAIFSGMIFGLSEYVDTVENFVLFTGEMISASDISDGIEIFYLFEDHFYDKELFMSFFVHDSELEEIRTFMVAIRTAYFNGDRTAANAEITLLRERLLQLRRAVMPTSANIL